MTFIHTCHDDGARHGTLTTRNGKIQTPFFMPDATRASVRGLTKDQLLSVGVEPMVVNTYHLMLQPTAEFLVRMGGVHTFMNWDGPLLTDSGGYQVYSLIHKNADLGTITENGAKFRSVLDGSWHMLTPERAMQIQFDIGSDMMVVLDDPRPPQAERHIHEEAIERTVRWAERCKKEFVKQCRERELDESTRPLLFAVVQGGPHQDLRERCAQDLTKIDFDGYGFGGRHVDEKGELMQGIITATAAALPEDKPRFALGIGTPNDIVWCYQAGWDMFDCVIPTREGRHGRIFIFDKNANDKLHMINDKESINRTSQISHSHFYDTINITNEKFKEDTQPFSDTCDCYACTHYSRAYIRHLFRVNEPLGGQMAALHNLHFYTQLMDKLQHV